MQRAEQFLNATVRSRSVRLHSYDAGQFADWGWGDAGVNCLHASEVPGARVGMLDKETSCDTSTGKSITPHFDSIAAAGLRFTDFHVGAAVCTPS